MSGLLDELARSLARITPRRGGGRVRLARPSVPRPCVHHRLRPRLPFDPKLPRGFLLQAIAASPTAVYIAYYPSASGDEFKVGAFDLASGAELYDFDPTNVEANDPLLMTYADGKLVNAGNGKYSLAAYNAKTGAPIWQEQLGWGELNRRSGLVTDGQRVFVGTPGSRDRPPISAFAVEDGKPIPGWGIGLRKDKQGSAGQVYGISGSKVLGIASYFFAGQRRGYLVTAARTNGHPVTLPQLPRDVVLFFGTGRTIVGEQSDRGILVQSVYRDPSGQRIGTISVRYRVFAQRDERHLLAYENLSDERQTRIVVLARPTG